MGIRWDRRKVRDTLPSQALICRTRKPAFVFLITHIASGEKILWDLGIREEFKDDYPHPSFDHFQTHYEKDVLQILQELGYTATDIDKVIISRKYLRVSYKLAQTRR